MTHKNKDIIMAKVVLTKDVRTLDFTCMLNEVNIQKRKQDMKYYDLTQKYLYGKEINDVHLKEMKTKLDDLNHLKENILDEMKTTTKTYTNSSKLIALFLKVCEDSSKHFKMPIIVKDKKQLHKDKEPPKLKIQNTDPQIRLSPKQIEKVKNANKNVLKDLFKFSNIEECASSKRSMMYFMSKENIIDIIDKNPKLKARMPSKFRSLKKEELCKVLFDKN
jgi:hypothetical protein